MQGPPPPDSAVTMVPLGKRIPIEELRGGMFVAGVYDQTDAIIYSASTLISDERQIDSLKRSGAVSVVIIPDRSSGKAERKSGMRKRRSGMPWKR